MTPWRLEGFGWIMLACGALTACGDDGSATDAGAGGAGSTSQATSTSGTSTGGCTELDCGLIHAYRFDQAGELADGIGSADAVTVQASSFTAAGQTDAAWELDATLGDHVALPPGMLHGLTSLTVCVWFSVGSTGSGDQSLFSWHNEVDGGNLALQSGPWWSLGNTVSGGMLNADGWQLMCGISDGTETRGLKLYVNGAFVGDDVGHGSIQNDGATPSVAIGASVIGFNATPENFFGGFIDEVYLWDRPLEAGEVTSVYNLAGARFW